MAAPAPPGGLAALVDFVEVENLGAVPDFYGWAGIEGDFGDFVRFGGSSTGPWEIRSTSATSHLSPSLISRTSSGIYECPHLVQTSQNDP